MKWCAICQMIFSTGFFQIGNVNCPMSERIHVLAQQLFNKASLEECNLQEVTNLSQQYPYFAPAQLLLLEKLKQEKDASYEPQLQKAVLYYADPLEFEYLIAAEKFHTDISFEETEK